MDPTPTPIVSEIFTELTLPKSDLVQLIAPIVLAVFAVLAFLVQRSRYLIETDISVEIRVQGVRLIETWNGDIDILDWDHQTIQVDLTVRNMSQRQLNFKAFPIVVQTLIPLSNSVVCQPGSFATRISDVPAGQVREIPRQFDFASANLIEGQKLYLSISYPIQLDYKRDLLQGIVQPWTLGRRSISREIQFNIYEKALALSEEAPLNISRQNVFLPDEAMLKLKQEPLSKAKGGQSDLKT